MTYLSSKHWTPLITVGHLQVARKAEEIMCVVIRWWGAEEPEDSICNTSMIPLLVLKSINSGYQVLEFLLVLNGTKYRRQGY